jgi:hypothetical protein
LKENFLAALGNFRFNYISPLGSFRLKNPARRSIPSQPSRKRAGFFIGVADVF